MSDANNCYHNAFMESCFGTLKTEQEPVEYNDSLEVVRGLSSYVSYYNPDRRRFSSATSPQPILSHDCHCRFKDTLGPRNLKNPTVSTTRSLCAR